MIIFSFLVLVFINCMVLSKLLTVFEFQFFRFKVEGNNYLFLRVIVGINIRLY